MDYNKVKSVIEGLLFAVGDEGIDLKQLATIIELDVEIVNDLIHDMQGDFKREKRGIQIVQLADSYQLTTLPEHIKYFERLATSPNNSTLSQAALETLGIIAYKQPVTKSDIEEIRGVQSERALKTLLNKELIKEVGRLDTIGRPIVYGTTRNFLDYFGLKTLSELPPLSEQIEICEEEECSLFS
ncbi:MAG: SMC-Scp complex subunit ScpB [Vulcanibacillus sp.]